MNPLQSEIGITLSIANTDPDPIMSDDAINSEVIMLPDIDIKFIAEETSEQLITIEEQDEQHTEIFLEVSSADETRPDEYDNIEIKDNQIVVLAENEIRCISNLMEMRNQPPAATYGKTLKTYSAVRNPNSTTLPYVCPVVSPVSINSSEETLNSEVPAVTSVESPVKPKPIIRTYSKAKRPKVVSTKSAKEAPIQKNARTSEINMPIKKKRRLVMDAFKVIRNSEFKTQLQDTKDIVQPKTDLAPATKKAMYFLTYGGVGKFFAYPGRKILSVPLAKLFFSHLTVTTEVRSAQIGEDGEVTPLDPELRSPVTTSSKTESSVVSYMGPHLYNDSLAKRAANSFDHLIKGMNVTRTKKSHDVERRNVYRDSRKGTVVNQQSVQESQHTNSYIMKLDSSEFEDLGSEVVECKPIDSDEVSVKIPLHVESSDLVNVINIPVEDVEFASTMIRDDCLEVKSDELKHEIIISSLPETASDSYVYSEDTGNPVLYDIDDSSKADETFTVSEESENIFFCNSNEGSDQDAAQVNLHSNLEMLLAAAEQHHGTMEIADNIEIASTGVDLEVDENNGADSKNGVVYCTAESDADGGLIIVDGSGRRYTVSSNSSGLTLWPETK